MKLLTELLFTIPWLDQLLCFAEMLIFRLEEKMLELIEFLLLISLLLNFFPQELKTAPTRLPSPILFLEDTELNNLSQSIQ